MPYLEKVFVFKRSDNDDYLLRQWDSLEGDQRFGDIANAEIVPTRDLAHRYLTVIKKELNMLSMEVVGPVSFDCAYDPASVDDTNYELLNNIIDRLGDADRKRINEKVNYIQQSLTKLGPRHPLYDWTHNKQKMFDMVFEQGRAEMARSTNEMMWITILAQKLDDSDAALVRIFELGLDWLVDYLESL